ncbi:MAG: hypothetical protein ACUVV4_07950 [Candidatus Bathyarchaeia archaeon]
MDDGELLSQLKGNTLRAYWALLESRDGVIGVRELQRRLRLSSPNLALYHLNKLEELGLAVNDRGDYRLVREVKAGIFREFVKLGTFRLPRLFLYSTMFTCFFIFFLTQFKALNFYSLYAFVTSILAVAVLWFETFKTWRLKP